MRCVDVAALFAAAILRRNPESIVIPFDTRAYNVRIDPKDTILSLSERMAKYGGGGTDCSIPLAEGWRRRLRRRGRDCRINNRTMSRQCTPLRGTATP